MWSALDPEERRGLDAARDVQWLRRLIESRRLAVGVWAMPALFLGVAIDLAMSEESIEEPNTLAVLSSIGMAGVIVALSYRKLLRVLLSRRRARLCGQIPMCAVCGYRLSGLAAGDDGCVVCPECAAAWRITPPTEAA